MRRGIVRRGKILIETRPHPGDPDYTRYSTLRDWVAVIFRQRRLFAVCFCGTLAGACLFAWLWAARYFQSSMQILVMPDQMASAATSSSAGPAVESQEVTEGEINSEVALLQGADLLQEVAGSCRLNERTGIGDSILASDATARSRARLERSARSLAQSLHVEIAKQADVINVSYGAVGSRETPACVLATLGRLYLEKRLQLRRPPGLLDFFGQETEKYKQALGSTEEALSTFGAHDAVAPDIQRTLVAQKLVETQVALRNAEQSVAEDVQRLRSQLQQLGATSPRVVTQEHDQAAGELLQQLEPQLLAAQLRREQLAMKFAADYPLLKEADQEVADAQAAVVNGEKMQLRDQTTDQDATFELLRQEVAKSRADLAERQASVSSLKQSIRALQEQAVQLDQEALQFQGLVRDAKADEANYLLYLSKREQERSAEALDDRRIANVSIAVPPSVPVLPAYSPIRALAIGLLLAPILGVTAAFVGEYLDGSFRTPADVADTLGVTVLASMPKQAA